MLLWTIILYLMVLSKLKLQFRFFKSVFETLRKGHWNSLLYHDKPCEAKLRNIKYTILCVCVCARARVLIWIRCCVFYFVFFRFSEPPRWNDFVCISSPLARGSHPSSVAASGRVSFFMSLTIRKIAAFFWALGVTLICFKALARTETDSSA